LCSQGGGENEFKTRNKVLFSIVAALLSVVAATLFGVAKAEISNVDGTTTTVRR
jgi:hypothetical protein